MDPPQLNSVLSEFALSVELRIGSPALRRLPAGFSLPMHCSCRAAILEVHHVADHTVSRQVPFHRRSDARLSTAGRRRSALRLDFVSVETSWPTDRKIRVWSVLSGLSKQMCRGDPHGRRRYHGLQRTQGRRRSHRLQRYHAAIPWAAASPCAAAIPEAAASPRLIVIGPSVFLESTSGHDSIGSLPGWVGAAPGASHLAAASPALINSRVLPRHPEVRTPRRT